MSDRERGAQLGSTRRTAPGLPTRGHHLPSCAHGVHRYSPRVGWVQRHHVGRAPPDQSASEAVVLTVQAVGNHDAKAQWSATRGTAGCVGTAVPPESGRHFERTLVHQLPLAARFARSAGGCHPRVGRPRPWSIAAVEVAYGTKRTWLASWSVLRLWLPGAAPRASMHWPDRRLHEKIGERTRRFPC
jgi:hypothetical protein